MLKSIYVKNYILIDELELDFADGLNIITGETGAGKSILINAIDIALGGRAGKEVIKTGTDKAVIELTVHNESHNLADIFQEYGIDDNGEDILISKEISQSGSKSKINGCMVNMECLKTFREIFLDIHSQHQTYSLLQQKNHIKLLDAYIKSTNLDEYKALYSEFTDLKRQLEDLQKASQKTEEQIDFLKFQVNEIESAEIESVDEDEKLSNELAILENAEKLKELTGSSHWALSGDDNSITDALYEIKNSISKAAGMDNTLEQTELELADIIDGIKAISSNLREYSSSMDCDEAKIDEIQERLFILDKLKRKYGGTLEKVAESGDKLRKELDGIEFSTQNIEALNNKITDIENKLTQKAKIISEERKQYGEVLSALVEEKLEKLELPKVKFKIAIETVPLNVDGCDRIEFMISTNVSEDLKPIAKIASGGEISRIMLAIKAIFAKSDNIDTVIFDEIDTGISGKTSQSLAEEVKELSKYMQIIMITHQAIIAAKSDRHFYVKKTQDDSTNVNIYILEDKNKVMGIAELVSGEITDESMKLAQTLINA